MLSPRALLCGAVCLAAITGGCGDSPAAERVATFGATASVVVRDVAFAYDAVERAHYRTQAASLILDFDTKGFDPSRIKPFLTKEDMAPRRALLVALQRYADLLQEVSGNKPIERLNTEVAAFGDQLKALASNPALQKIAANTSPAQIAGLTAAIDAFGQILIRHERGKALSPILRSMQDVIDRMCALLNADLGSGPDVTGIGGRGLRGQLWLQYDQLMIDRKAFIDRNKTAMPPGEKADEIARLPELVKEQRAADDALAATQLALDDMATAHRALIENLNGGGSFAGRIAELKQDAVNIAGFYDSLKIK